MKKILIVIATVCICNGAYAQNEADQGQKIRVVTGTQQTTTNVQTTTHVTPGTPATHKVAVKHTTTKHHAYNSTVYKKHTVHHKTTHSYAKEKIAHKNTHSYASTHKIKSRHPRTLSMQHANAYTGNKQIARPMTAQEKIATEKKEIDNTMNKDYPGQSNGGWSNGVSGKGGTNSNEGTIQTTDKK